MNGTLKNKINASIKSNCHKNITAPVLNSVLNNVVNLVNTIEFPADDSVNILDVGKFVVNKNGKAKVAMATPDVGNGGEWNITVAKQFQGPVQSAYSITITQENLVGGDTFNLFGDTFTFSTTPSGLPYVIEIGIDKETTIANISDKLNGINPERYYTSHNETHIELIPGALIPGDAGNYMNFETNNESAIFCSLEGMGFDFDLANVNDVILEWTINSVTYTLTLGEACDLSVPQGTAFAGYKWPEDIPEQMVNMMYALQQNPHFNADFIASMVDDIIVITEKASPVSATTIFTGSIYTGVEIISPGHFEPGYVPDIIIGQLRYVENGTAFIYGETLLKVRLSTHSEAILFGEEAALMPERMLRYGNDGEVIKGVNLADERPLYHANGFMLALTEAEPGEEVLVRTFPFSGSIT